ncbi:MAG: sugar phosphate isomerase/epimerase [Bacteroidetes bacterium]|nr:sugar phosphate isomerase/epimerase [Bacteroidota bacterium]
MSIKLALAVAPENALPSAFVVFRDDIEVSMSKAADLGYDGIELALLHREQVNPKRILGLAQKLNLDIPVVSTGQVFAEGGMWFTADDISIREKAIVQFSGLMEVAADFGADINIGRLRGFVAADQSRDQAEMNFITCLEILSDRAENLGIRILIEPVNRYEINYINSCRDGGRLLDKLNRPNVLLMPDVFHMNIEDVDIPGELDKYFDKIGYIHFADSNRYYPGNAHMDFPTIIQTLKKNNYNGYIGVEILPDPDPDTAAAESIAYLGPLL